MTDTAPPNGATRPFAGFEWLIAWRYMLAKRREGGISVIVWYSLIGVALAVGTLIVVMAVMYGFRQEFTSRILGAEGHAKIYPTVSFVNDRQVRAIYEAAAQVAGKWGCPVDDSVIHALVQRTGSVAQAQIGAAAVGATAEDPKMFGKGIVLMVLPETIVILGFVVAFLLLGKVA